MEKTKADIAILAANFNNGPFLEDFLNSIFDSSVIPSQIILVDDGSTDNSIEILKKYESHQGAEFLYLDENKGFANALNEGISRIQTSFVMRADPDDILHPHKMEQQLEFLKAHPHIAGAGCNVAYFNSSNGKFLNNSNFPISTASIRKAYEKGEHGIQHPTVMIRTDVLKQFSYRQDMVPAEDYALFAEMTAKGFCFANLKEVLYRMRIHPASVSSRINFETVKKTFNARDEIFRKRTSLFCKWLCFFHILHYRKYMLEKRFLVKYNYLMLSILFYPQKLIKRIYK